MITNKIYGGNGFSKGIFEVSDLASEIAFTGFDDFTQHIQKKAS